MKKKTPPCRLLLTEGKRMTCAAHVPMSKDVSLASTATSGKEARMNRYTIYCTEEQTEKAFELGCPLYRLHGTGCSDYIDMLVISDTEAYTIPTAEQMVGWLEDKELLISITAHNTPDNPIYNYSINRCEESWKTFSSRKEATLVAIDVALDYLRSTKEVNH